MVDTVTVALKLPMDYVVEHKGRKVRLNGWNHGRLDGTPNREGFGLTPGIDAGWFASWLAFAMEHGVDLVRNNLVFANGTDAGAQAQGRERDGDVKSGMEGLDAANPMVGVGPNGETITLAPNDETQKMLDENAKPAK